MKTKSQQQLTEAPDAPIQGISISEACRLANISESALYRAITAGHLPAPVRVFAGTRRKGYILSEWSEAHRANLERARQETQTKQRRMTPQRRQREAAEAAAKDEAA